MRTRAQYWIAHERLNDHRLFEGDTTEDERTERLRQAIIDRGIADEPCGKIGARVETYRQLFKRVFGVELTGA